MYAHVQKSVFTHAEEYFNLILLEKSKYYRRVSTMHMHCTIINIVEHNYIQMEENYIYM